MKPFFEKIVNSECPVKKTFEPIYQKLNFETVIKTMTLRHGQFLVNLHKFKKDISYKIHNKEICIFISKVIKKVKTKYLIEQWKMSLNLKCHQKICKEWLVQNNDPSQNVLPEKMSENIKIWQW